MDPFFRSDRDRHPITLVREVRVSSDGVTYRLASAGRDGNRVGLPWSQISAVLVADVGEPEGVRAVVFDLIAESEGASCAIVRFDAEPGEEARAVARALLEGANASHAACAAGRAASLRELAKEGTTTRWYPDLESFEDANWSEFRRGQGPRRSPFRRG